MNVFFLSLCLLCLMGCGKGDNHQTKRRVVYPALTESPQPLLPTHPNFSEDLDEEPEPIMASDTADEGSWMEKRLEKEALIRRLKEQAAENPDDPFALTAEVIEELSQVEDLAIQ